MSWRCSVRTAPGKSTLIKVLGGIVRADEGTVSIGGAIYRHRVQAVGACSPRRLHPSGSRPHRMDDGRREYEPRRRLRRPAPDCSAPSTGGAPRSAPPTRSALIGGDIDPTSRVHSLSRTEKSLVAIARALVVECDFLVLDEPTASLPANEVERLFAAIRRLKARGVGMIYVSHRLDEIFRIADRVVVMRDGAMVGEKPVAETTPEELVALIVGRSNLDMFRKAPLKPGPGSLDRARIDDAQCRPGRFRTAPGRVARSHRLARGGAGGGRARACSARCRIQAA